MPPPIGRALRRRTLYGREGHIRKGRGRSCFLPFLLFGPSSLIPVVVHDGLDDGVGVGGELPEAEAVLRPRRLELELPRRPQEGVLVAGVLRDEDVAGGAVGGGSAVLAVRKDIE